MDAILLGELTDILGSMSTDSDTKHEEIKSLLNTIDANLDTVLTTNTSHGTKTYSTAGTYSWTCPEGIGMVFVTLVGGGGGGGAGGSCCFNTYSDYGVSGGGGSGGGSGALITAVHGVVPGTSYTVVVGAGGSAGTCTISTDRDVVGDLSGVTYAITTESTAGGFSRFGNVRANGGGKGANGGCGNIMLCSGYNATEIGTSSYAKTGGTAGSIEMYYIYGITYFQSGAAGGSSTAGSVTTSNLDKLTKGASGNGGLGRLSAGGGGAGGNGATYNTNNGVVEGNNYSSSTGYSRNNKGAAGFPGSAGGAGKVVIAW